ncbi:putative atp synthase subunit mitochondrial protein [Erysiphe neolycopersici]|uniref:Putative atp synthase subunit mitochondrial protein n=1 Tax=Erysiphe neolycopersici TaxID=212602 RepID=A0A420HZF4_9PEZI|nr:putative atp synthase subunit mitochondrial protein [Erysiphe neolycopersici]
MMATEPTSGNIDTRPPLSNNELINSSEEPSKSCKNISEETAPNDDDLKHDLEIPGPKINSVAGSACGGSDSDTLKLETSKVEGEEKGHLRNTSTVKKQTTFKPVSVNKKFLAAKGSTSTSLSKLGEKNNSGSTSAQALPLVGSNSARPRLVAKSGPGIHATPRTTATSNGSKTTGAPDASVVWNKNRPAPPPEPKRYSDEELKQRYGIHLATRLQSDDSGKQANWADIDDDDDDWVPNTMEWADGTKSTLPQVDEIPTSSPTPPAPEPVASIEKVIESTKSKSPGPTKILASPTVKTKSFSGRAGLVLKSGTEKPSSLSKQPVPTSVVKSPWAPLPPVEKVAPILTAISQQQPRQSRTGQKDSLNNVPQVPAKEIAADDFRRTWRDGPNTSRELYNAQSGRYEPANDRRRGSLRNEARPHQPSVLQRSNQESPAEPSPAFQTFRSGGQDTYARRRNSSNVSVGSEKTKRRMSRGDIPPAHEVLATQREPPTAGSDEPISPSISTPSAQQPHQPNHQSQVWQSSVQASVSYQSPKTKNGKVVAINAAPSDSEKQVSPVVYEDPFEVQKKAMRLSRELAIARRREQEEKEAAEKQERIRIKLASMGPSPEKIKKEPLRKEKKSPQPQTCVPSKQIADETDNVVSETNKSNLDASESKEKVPISSSVESNPVVQHISSEVKRNADHISQSSSPQNQSHQSWNSNTNDRFKPWAPAPSQQSSSRNVWGPPTNDRTLGNGTFNPELSRLPEISSHPGPIGPLTANRGNSHGQGREYSRPVPIGPPNRRQTLSLAQDLTVRSAVANSGWSSLPSKIAEEDAKSAQLQDIEMSRIRALREKGLHTEPPPPVVHDTWRQVSMNENGDRSKIQATNTTIHNEHRRSWQDKEDAKAVSIKGISKDQEIVQRRSLDTIGTQHKFSDAWKASNVNATPIRDSRFFPNNKDATVVFEDQSSSLARPESPCPPPPTQQGHPAYDGNIAHPHVSLPRPPPIVKLPPPKVVAPIGPPRPTSFAAVVATPAIPAIFPTSNVPNMYRNASRIQPRISKIREINREESVAGNWQDKIDSLIGRKSSPNKTKLFAVDSYSKKALEVPNQKRLANVSLPTRTSPISSDMVIDTRSAVTKPASEVCFEEQEMGSLPPVKMPLKPPAAAWHLAPTPKPLPKRFLLVQSTSVEAITFSQQTTNNSLSLTINVPGQLESKNISIRINRQQKSGGRRSSTRFGTNQRNRWGQKGRS